MSSIEKTFNSRLFVGDVVKVHLPRGHNKRGVWGISVLYATSQEANFDGATGTVVEIQPEGPHTIPLHLVDFRTHDNSRAGLPWQAHWFREEFLDLVERADSRAPDRAENAPV